MKKAQREAFLLRWLPGEEFEEWYDLLTDFRQYGFRVLGDVVGDIDDANNGTDRKQLHRVEDSEAFATMMQAHSFLLYPVWFFHAAFFLVVHKHGLFVAKMQPVSRVCSMIGSNRDSVR